MTSTSSRPVVYSTRHAAEIEDHPIDDIDSDPLFSEAFALSRQYTMTSKEVMYALYQAVRYVHDRGIPGDFVECGVWRGGSSLLAATTFLQLEAAQPMRAPGFLRRLRPAQDRRFWLYDTYEGMTVPTAEDVDLTGGSASDYIERYSDDGKWCYADLADVRNTLLGNGIPEDRVEFVKGDVLETLKTRVPRQAAILRLDTDWYESTKFELETLYPRLATGGVLIIDDYGHWQGSRKAVDEFFARRPPLLLNRTSYAVRTAVKI
jgi:O-methyltransferase